MNPSSLFTQPALQWPLARLDASEKQPRVWAAVLGGAGLGLTWGVAARVWMRLIATQPEFSIFGTAALLTIATLFGAFTGLALAARRRGWRRWGHYGPRTLAVIFFFPFGAFGGTPLMLTVLLATLGLTQRAVVGLWFLAALAMLVVAGTDFGVPPWAVGLVLALAMALTAWKWAVRRWPGSPKLRQVDVWLERLGRASLLLLAAYGFWNVASDILRDKPGWLGLVCVLFYFILLYVLFLALRVGLKPKAPAGLQNPTSVS